MGEEVGVSVEWARVSAFCLHSMEQTSSSVASQMYWPRRPQMTQTGPVMGAAGASLEKRIMGVSDDGVSDERFIDWLL